MGEERRSGDQEEEPGRASSNDASAPSAGEKGSSEDADSPEKGGDADKAPDKKGAQKGEPGKKQDKPKALWPWILAGIVVAGFVAIVLLIIFLPKRVVRTNDAYVAAHYAAVAPRIGGQVVQVLVEDNQPVRAGDLLVVLDERDYQTALEQAEAALASDRAQVAAAAAELARQPTQVSKALAEEASVQARLRLTDADVDRFAALATSGAGTVRQHQEADSQLRQDLASLRSARADVDAARLQLRTLQANLATAQARVQGDEAAVERARLNLSYCRIRAPIDGTVDQRSVQVGDILAPGAAMMIEVPLGALYVTANYRELALRHMRPGQHARIHVDAYDIWLDGVVGSIAPASGAALSPIPPNNATGNFTKIIQRLPVKILIAPGQPLAKLLRLGMSVEVDVDTGLENIVADQRRARGRVTAP